MMNKRSVELSLNFLVVIIISIVLFGLGISFISRLSSQATDLKDRTIEDLDIMIGNLLCEGSERVCIGIDTKTIRRASFDVFGLKIVNILDSQNFDVTISRPTPSGYTKDAKDITNDNLFVNPQSRSLFIQKNDEKSMGIGIQVPAEAVPGRYIFNVQIYTQDGQQYTSIQKIYVDVP